MKWSVVNLCEVINQIGSRIDSEYWHPENIKIINKIKRNNSLPLGEFIDAGYRVVYENTEILSSRLGKQNKLPKFIQAVNIILPPVKSSRNKGEFLWY